MRVSFVVALGDGKRTRVTIPVCVVAPGRTLSTRTSGEGTYGNDSYGAVVIIKKERVCIISRANAARPEAKTRTFPVDASPRRTVKRDAARHIGGVLRVFVNRNDVEKRVRKSFRRIGL